MAIGAPVSLGSSSVQNYGSSDATHTTTASVLAGARIFIVVGFVAPGTPQTAAISGGGLSWAEDKVQTGHINDGGSDFYYYLAIWSAYVPTLLASSTAITCAFSGTTYGANLGAFYATGIASDSPVDVTAGRFRDSSTLDGSWSSTAAATTNANDLLIGVAFGDGPVGSHGPASTPAGSFTELLEFFNDNDWSTTTTYRIVSATGSYSASGTWDPPTPSFADSALLVAYKAQSFPNNTLLLDDFNRANTNLHSAPASNGDTWAPTEITSLTGLSVVSNQVENIAGGYGSERTGIMYGPDVETYITVVSIGGTGSGSEIFALYARLNDPAGSPTCYMIEVHEGTLASHLFLRVNPDGTQVNLGYVNSTINNGDKVGFSVRGSTTPILAMWKQDGGVGAWNQIDSNVVDDFSVTPPPSTAPYLGSGYLGIEIFTTLPALDDFNGGPAVAASYTSNPKFFSFFDR